MPLSELVGPALLLYLNVVVRKYDAAFPILLDDDYLAHASRDGLRPVVVPPQLLALGVPGRGARSTARKTHLKARLDKLESQVKDSPCGYRNSAEKEICKNYFCLGPPQCGI